MYFEAIRKKLFPQDISFPLQVKTWWDLDLMASVILGVQFCNIAMTAIINPLLLKMGFIMTTLTLNMSKSPIISTIFVPVFAILSDSCNWKIGGRRLFILFVSSSIIGGLVLIPVSKALHLSRGSVGSIYVMLTAAGATFLNFGCEACLTLVRAFMIDVTLPQDHVRGLSYFTILAGIGGIFRFFISTREWEQLLSYAEDYLDIIFTILIVEFAALLILTLRSSGEITREFENVIPSLVGNKNPIVEQTLAIFHYGRSILFMPTSLLLLIATQFFSWISLLCYMLYTSDLGEEFEPDEELQGTIFSHERVYIGTWGVIFFYCSSIFYAAALDCLLKLFGVRGVYAGSLFLNIMATFTVAAFQTPAAVMFLSASAGVQFAAMQTLPFLLLARYHGGDVEYYGRGLATDIAALSITAFLAQIGLVDLRDFGFMLYFEAFFGVLAVGALQFITYV